MMGSQREIQTIDFFHEQFGYLSNPEDYFLLEWELTIDDNG